MPLTAMLWREWVLAQQRRAELVQPILFFSMVVTLFALGSEPGSGLLSQFAPAMIWVAVLLAALIGAEKPYREDFEDGTVEQLVLAPVPLSWLMLCRMLMQWLVTGLPVSLLAIPAAAALGVPSAAWPVLIVGLLLGAPVLAAIAGFAACLTVAMPRAGLLLPILVLPLMAPVVIFGSGAVRAVLGGLPVAAPLYFLAALLLLSLCLAPWGMAAALRNALD